MPGPNLKFPRRRTLCGAMFTSVLRSGRALRGQGLVVLYKVSELPDCRLGMVISKRVAKRSVDRNRYKRLIREWFRHNQGRLAGRDWVVRLAERRRGSSALPISEVELLSELERLIPKA